MRNVRLLLVEDDPLFRAALKEVLEGAGYLLRTAASGAEALAITAEESCDLVIQDIKLPDANGLDILREILARHPHTGALVMTGYGTIDDAVTAMKLGAFDFLTKPFPMETLLLKTQSFLEFRKLSKEVSCLPEEASPFCHIVTRSPVMKASLEIACRASRSRVPVIILGESGTGKELVAQAIHRASPRADAPFMELNCAAIPANLMESELFGVEKGAYTGAEKSRAGYIEMADGGTLFLDEIGELPLDLQGKILKAIEQKAVTRIGGTTSKSFDFRLITATNRDLADMVQRREFRNDLFFRINVVAINLPPLRERREDIPLLLASFLESCALESGVEKPEFAPETLTMLSSYSFPGNVRELKNIVERVCLLYPGETVLPRHLPPELHDAAEMGSSLEMFSVGKPLKEAVADFERRYIEKVVHYAGGQKTLAARLLGLSRKVLWEKLKK